MKEIALYFCLSRKFQARALLVLPLICYTVLGLFIYADYGIGPDEERETRRIIETVQVIPDLLENGLSNIYEKLWQDTEYYGQFFNLLAYPAQVYAAKSSPLQHDLNALVTKHLFNLLFNIITLASVATALWLLTRSIFSSVVAVLFLSLNPYFFSMAFFLPKDPPFAAMLTLSSLLAALSISKIVPDLQSRVSLATFFKKHFWPLFGISIVVGLTASIRIGGPIILFHAAITVLFLCFCNRYKESENIFRWPHFIAAGCFVATIVFLIVWLMYPAAWPNLFKWLGDTLAFNLHLPNDGVTILNGEEYEGRNPPWFYLLATFFYQTPVLWVAGVVIGFIQICFDWKRMDTQKRAVVSMLALQLLTMPLVAIFAGSSLYAGYLHFIFTIPAMAFFGGYAVIAIWKSRSQLPRYVLTAYATFIAVEMISIHPYQHEYINEVSRSDAADNWQIDRFFTSAREAAAWLNTHAEKNSGVHTNFGEWIIRPYLRPDLHAEFEHTKLADRPHVYSVASQSGAGKLIHGRNCLGMSHTAVLPLLGQPIALAKIRKCY